MDSETALEYLMSYGWILLVVAIVGGAIYTTVTEGPNVKDDPRIDEPTNLRGVDGVQVFQYKEMTCFKLYQESIDCQPTERVEQGVIR